MFIKTEKKLLVGDYRSPVAVQLHEIAQELTFGIVHDSVGQFRDEYCS